MAIHELDELEPDFSRPVNTNISARALFPLAGDLEETRVRIEIPTKGGGTVFVQCVVRHDGETVHDVRLPDGHGALADVAGITWEAAAEWEGYLSILARIEFARGGR